MSHTKEPWASKKDMIYGNEKRESVACVLDGLWPHGFRPNAEANAQRIVSCVNALEGLSDDALNGGWNFKSVSKYCKDIESQRDELLKVLENIMNDWLKRADCVIPKETCEKAIIAIAKAKGE